METERIKYPRTPHLPWSAGRSADDIALDSTCHLEKIQAVVVTEKLDGENTTMYRSYIHARSPHYTPHASRDWVRRLHAEIRHEIPEGFRVCGENLYARHSVGYNALPSYFLVFAIFQEDMCLAWDAVLEWCQMLGLVPVPELYRGPWDETTIRACWRGCSACGPEQEGYVVRNAASFQSHDFQLNTAKYVRPGHVTDDEHWMNKPVRPNLLARAAQ